MMDLLADVVSSAQFSPLPVEEEKERAHDVSFTPHPILYPAPLDGASWAGLTPLEMVEKIVLTAARSATFQAETNPRLVKANVLLQNNFLPAEQANQSVTYEEQPGQKRKRDDVLDEDACLEQDEAVLALLDSVDVQPPNQMLIKFQPSENATLSESSYYDDLQDLVTSLESRLDRKKEGDESKQWVIPSYNRVQQALRSKVLVGPDEALAAIDDATSQMGVLLTMLSNKSTAVKNVPTVSFEANAPDVFQNYMNFWLQTNWTNPFPDDNMNLHLARFMIQKGCVPLTPKDEDTLLELAPNEYDQKLIALIIEKINNFLVNTRTRKWRPSLEQAFNNRRPAALLLEDSVRIFKEEPLRPVANWDGDKLYSFDPKYLTDLKKWKKPKEGEGKGKGGKKAKGGTATKESTAKKKSANKKVSPRLLPLRSNAPTPQPPLPPIPHNGNGLSFDHSPCSAFVNAGGPMMLEEMAENDTSLSDVPMAQI